VSISEALTHRICSTAHATAEPSFRATGKYRFDDANLGFKTLYCAHDFGTCFMETLLRGKSQRHVLKADYDSRSVVLLVLDVKQLELVDMHSTEGLSVLDLDLSIIAGGDYTQTQRIAALAYSHPSAPHGIAYRSRFDPDRMAFVLFDRAARYVRTFPGTLPQPLGSVEELSDALRTRVPFDLV
jgi:hypothetical protein